MVALEAFADRLLMSAQPPLTPVPAPLCQLCVQLVPTAGSKERYNANCSARESFVFQDRLDLICDCLCFAIVSVVMIPDAALNIKVN
jgi:hypothetical protein